MPDTEARHPIQVVARRTGLSADVIRVWERRYRVVEPQRASNARRLYSDADVERLTLLRQATAAGRRIGDVAALSTAALRELVAADASAAPTPVSGGLGAARDHLAGCRNAVADMDPRAFHQALTNSALTYNEISTLAQLYSRMGVGYFNKLEDALQKLAGLAPESVKPEAYYDLASIKAMTGKTSEALDDLRISMDLNAKRLKADPTAPNLAVTNRSDPRFDALRNLPEFQKIVPPN